MTDDPRYEVASASMGQVQLGNVLRIEVARLQPFLVEPDLALSFSDLQAAFGAGVFAGRRIAAMLAEAQLIRRIPPPKGGKPTYLCEKELIDLLTPRPSRPISLAQAPQCASEGIQAMTAWNGAARAARVVEIAFTGGVLEPSARTLHYLEVLVTVRVKRGGLLVQELPGLLRRLREVGGGSLRESLVLEMG
jgi:hypothetical protein